MELVIRMIRDSSSEQIMYKSTVEFFCLIPVATPIFMRDLKMWRDRDQSLQIVVVKNSDTRGTIIQYMYACKPKY